jgi:hypothetical protein
VTAPAPALQATTTATVEAFIARWQGVTASELATSQSFVIELCELLDVDRPHPSPEQTYEFERPVTFQHGDGSTSPGRIDLYRRGHFIWGSKKFKPNAGGDKTAKRFDDALLRARAQAEAYARALPASEGRPPFLVVVDVGHVIELYAEFSRSGATYTPFPDPRSHRIRLSDLAQAPVRQRLRALWTDPLSLDPARVSSRVTRQVAAELATLARSLEQDGHPAETVAAFLTRCLFSMFAEDVGLLPRPATAAEGTGAFTHLLREFRDKPDTLARMLTIFWQGCDTGGFNAAIAADVLHFNGKLFKGAGSSGYALHLSAPQVDGLLRAAKADWREVEPAIFGTLLERALDPTERHALGAHYTPRAYVERLVLPTVVEPLRDDWANARAAALLLVTEAEAFTAPKDAKKREAKLAEARAEAHRFHHQLCTVRVLDPACGSGNFLYITLEHLKRLEGEVLDTLAQLGETEDRQDKLELAGETVTLQQLRGIELNPRAAALAELVLWIGWLQWHLRTRGPQGIAEPVVHDYKNIECRDAVLAYDGMEPAEGPDGKPLLRWDGKTTKPHPVTGEPVPDEAAQVMQWRYLNPRAAEWPQADFIVGNPPYLGARTIRAALGDGYLSAVRSVHPSVPENADFVMYWWDTAAALVTQGTCRAFGLITTNSLRQSFNRAVLEQRLSDEVRLAFAIPDHPWVDAKDGAAIRVALSVVAGGKSAGRLALVADESPSEDRETEVSLVTTHGLITPGLTIGIDVAASAPLRANAEVSCVGYQLSGQGFVVSAGEASSLDARIGTASALARPLIGGRDLVQSPRGLFALDAFGFDEIRLRDEQPAIFQWVYDRVRPERLHNARASVRDRWWLFGEARSTFRPALAGTAQALATSLTAKHRLFLRVPADAVCDSTTVMFALPNGLHLGVLSSSVHVGWASAAGGTLEDRPRYNKSLCFETFPFPDDDTGLTPELTERIRTLAEQLDAHRKARQAAHEAVTLTGLYNVLDKLRRSEALNAKDKLLHEQGLVGVLKSLHDDLDAAVLAAYGWSDLSAVPWGDDEAHRAWTEALLTRLVALNQRRAAEEAQGRVRWLRPEFQDPARRQATSATPAPTQTELAVEAVPDAPAAADEAEGDAPATAALAPTRQPWPAELPAQMRAVADTLARLPGAVSEAALAEHFTGRGPWKKRLPSILQTLEALGRAQATDAGWRSL